MKKTVFFLLAALIAAVAAPAAAQVKYVAVVEAEADARSGVSEDLSAAEIAQITAELRREAVQNLPRAKYNIMTAETVIAQGGAVLEACADENCVITLGTKIGADYVVRGIISKFQTKLALTVEMYETENGTLVASSDPVRSESAAELLEKTAAACAEMYKKFADAQNAVKKPSGGYTAIGERKPGTPLRIKKTEPEPKPQPVTNAAPAAPPKPDAGLTQTKPAAPNAKKRYKLAAAISLDAIGAGVFLYGLSKDFVVQEKNDKELYADAEEARDQRNIAYIVGSVILLSGISIHIFF